MSASRVRTSKPRRCNVRPVPAGTAGAAYGEADGDDRQNCRGGGSLPPAALLVRDAGAGFESPVSSLPTPSINCQEDEAARLRDRLARVARATMLGELAAAIAHEVNQPLCAIVSNAETAQDYLAGCASDVAEARDVLQDIVADARRASEIVRRIRALFGSRQVERARFDLTAAIREVATLLRHKLTRDGVALTFDLGADGHSVLGDQVQIQQVLFNLMQNAAEALAGGPADRRRLFVAVARADSVVTVSVRDYGPGIAPDLLDRVFEPFFTTKPEGTGVGLSISRTIVEAHDGRIWAETAAGGGVAFCFTLPLEPAGPP